MSEEPKKRQMAGAIRIDAEDDLGPKLIGAGTGKLAERILEVARENDIPIHEDAELAKNLQLIEIGTVLPRELFPVVAEIIAHIYRVSRRYSDHPVHRPEAGQD